MARRLLPALAAFAASLVPFAAFWAAAPDAPRPVLLALFAAGVAAACGITWADRRLSSPQPVLVLAALWLLLAAYAAGVAATLAFLLFAAAACALGARLLARLQGLTAVERLVLAYLAGVAALVTAASLLLALPVHHPLAYAAVCAGALAWQSRALRELLVQVRGQAAGWRTQPFPTLLACTSLLVAAWGAMGAFTPIAAFDDLAYHLRLPYELLVHHRYSFDVAQQVWAAAPWAADLAFAIPFVMSGGHEGVKVWMASGWHAASAVLLLGLLMRRLPLHAALLFLMACLAVPLMMASTHALHTEGPSAALVLAIFTLWCWQRHASDRGVLFAVALMLAWLGAIKASNLVACAVLGLMWLPALWRARAAAAAGLATVLVPYATAWWVSGNPVLPLFNAFFRSPFFRPINFHNPDFAGRFDLSLFPGLFLAGRRYLETQADTAGGLVLFLLLPAAAILLARRGDTERRGALLVAVVYGVVLLASQQYLRYLFPVLGVAVFAATRVWDETVLRPWWTLLLVLSIVVGVYAMPRVTSQTRPELLRLALQPGGRAAYLQQVAPVRALNEAVNARAGQGAVVLYLLRSGGAELHGTPLYPTWYSVRTYDALAEVRDAASAAEALKHLRATHVVTHDPAVPLQPGEARVVALVEAHAFAHGRVVARSGALSLIELAP
jgi:hypothetical protein